MEQEKATLGKVRAMRSTGPLNLWENDSSLWTLSRVQRGAEYHIIVSASWQYRLHVLMKRQKA